MNELINVTFNENNEPVISARQLHKTLEVKHVSANGLTKTSKCLKKAKILAP